MRTPPVGKNFYEYVQYGRPHFSCVISGYTESHRIWEWLCDHIIMAIILAALASSATAYLKGVFDAILDDVLQKEHSCEADIVLFCIPYVFVKCSFSGRARV